MTTQTSTQTSWREYDDRDAHQDRLATELAADSGTDWQPLPPGRPTSRAAGP
jgi:hypothetical protein